MNNTLEDQVRLRESLSFLNSYFTHSVNNYLTILMSLKSQIKKHIDDPEKLSADINKLELYLEKLNEMSEAASLAMKFSSTTNTPKDVEMVDFAQKATLILSKMLTRQGLEIRAVESNPFNARIFSSDLFLICLHYAHCLVPIAKAYKSCLIEIAVEQNDQKEGILSLRTFVEQEDGDQAPADLEKLFKGHIELDFLGFTSDYVSQLLHSSKGRVSINIREKESVVSICIPSIHD